ncbi:MAG TPA: YceI family protein [Rhizomicrobium sp.]|jgi:polyisoprenoid-binding protein YceI|nr:YceI family protein [Rhizomicrobium sp.]
MRSKLALFAAVTLLGLGAPAFAATATKDTAPTAKAGTYAIDPRHTQVVFAIRHMGLSTFYGRFGAISGTLNFDPAAPEKSTLTATIDMTNIKTHVDELDRELKDSVFHVQKFPTATFTATDIVKTSASTGTVTGMLTLAGVTKPVTLNVTFNGGRNSPVPLQPYRAGFDATATIKRSDFGLDKAIWSGIVSDDVQLQIECELEKQ